MQKTLMTFVLAIFITIANSQTTTLTDLGDDYKTENFVAMTNNDNFVDGYFNFSIGEKLKKKQREFLLKIYDANLNLVIKKKHIDSKYLQLIGAKYNKQQIMLCFYNTKEREFKFIGFDKKGNKQKPHSIIIEKDDAALITFMAEKLKKDVEFIPIDNAGFAFMYFYKGKKKGYKIEFLPTNGGKSWIYGTPEKSKFNEYITFAGSSDKGISFYLFSKKSLLSKKTQVSSKILDINTGKLILDIPSSESTPKLLSNTFFEKDYFINSGEYFTAGDNLIKDASKGLYFNKYNYTGKLIGETKISWDNNIFGKFQVSKDSKNRNHLYIHDFIKTSDGHYYAITEEYKKSLDAVGVGLKALAFASALSGNGGQIGSGGATKLTIRDSHFIKMDTDFNLLEMTSFKKGKSTASCFSDFGSAQINAHAIKSVGGFDYAYTQTDTDKNRFYSMFVDFERLKGEKDKFALKSVIYNNGTFSEDKIYLSKGKVTTTVLPAKKGHVLLADYNKKEKTITLHLEKLNIE